MVFRQCGITIDGSESYYFDVQDLVENVHMACSNPTEVEFLKKDLDCDHGTKLAYILSFIIDYGLKSTSACTNPRKRDGLPHFDEKEKRHKINSFKIIPSKDVMWYAKHKPIIAVLRPYNSFKHLGKAVYDGPTLEEKQTKNSFDCFHAVLIVGSLKIKKHNTVENYVVVQNSYGTSFGLSGFAVIPLDCDYIFTGFVILMDPIPHHEEATQSEASASNQQGTTA
ncbi:uncharacterized protein [Primulina huaijiensis]|uniref:uncharacterized protein isoform X1 n=1 Tax=Primulina huaijiensis TaxID=1492673 RepID=UPI003CC76CFC